MGARGAGTVHAGPSPGGAAARSRPDRDSARGTRGAARPLPARARGRSCGRTLLVRRPRRRRVAQTYLELAVFLRALEGLADTARIRASLGRSSLWAGLFDLRENLLGRTLDDLRALAA